MIYHAFVKTPKKLDDTGHLAHVPYSDVESALEHARDGMDYGCTWGAVIDDGARIHYLSHVDVDLLNDALHRVERR